MLSENVERSTSQAINDTGLTDMQGQSVRRGIMNVVEDAKQSTYVSVLHSLMMTMKTQK